MDKGSWSRVYPINPLAGNDNPIEFLLNGSDSSYFDLNDTALYLKCRIVVEDATKKPAKGDCAPVNMLLCSVDN